MPEWSFLICITSLSGSSVRKRKGNVSPHLLVSGVGGGFDSPDNALSEYSPLSRFILMLDLVLAQVRHSVRSRE